MKAMLLPILLQLHRSVALVLLTSALVGCGERDAIRRAVENYARIEYGAGSLDRMIVGEGDAQNVYVKARFRNSKGNPTQVDLLVQKNANWKVVGEVKKKKRE